ncbi:HAMP domain-containing sensor histidine kinase [Prevotella sp. P6B4]|uniref:sensor histidine kinase n=1 Tax=Prevotella sp. P6B4 TaxID=1410614 RepID=UPI0018CC597D|nr:HAMP domain-containing sensor histidine kinase [Prevotella sp. P6B4]
MNRLLKSILSTARIPLGMLLIITSLAACQVGYRQQAAKQEGPVYDKLRARMKTLEYFYNNDQNDSLEAAVPEYMENCKNHRQWRLYYLAWNLLGQSYAFAAEYDQANHIAHAMQTDGQKRGNALGQVKGLALLAMIASLQGNHEEAERYWHEAIDTYDPEYGDRSTRMNLYYRLTETLLLKEAPVEQVDSALKQWKTVLDEEDPDKEIDIWQFNYYNTLVDYLIANHQFDDAIAAIDSAELYPAANLPSNKMNLIIDRSTVHTHLHHYSEAMTCLDKHQHIIDSMKQAGKQVSNQHQINHDGVLHALLAQMGRYQEAYAIKLRYDSLEKVMADIATRQQQMELNKHYDVDEMRRQNQQLQQRSRFTTGGVAMVLGIIAMLVFLTTSNRWRHTLEVKNRQLERERNVVVAQNRQLAVERDRAETASRAKTAFLQSMTHEIRTPLNAISGFTQVLAMTGLNLPENERQDFSNRIQDNTRLLTNILDDMILISNMEGNNALPQAEPCVPLMMITGATEAIAQQVAKGVTIDSQCNIPAEETLMCHPRLIGIIISKLLDNAAKFTKQGHITLSLNREADKLHFAVTDTGCGIPADKSEAIFERFTKLDSFTQGTGLGLSVARMVAEHMGGTLTLDTNYTGGAKFDLIIPYTANA